jgi:signal transduction histidine kinase
MRTVEGCVGENHDAADAAVRPRARLIPHLLLERARSPSAGLVAAAVIVAAVTLLLYPLQELDPGVSSGVLYVLGVLLVSICWGLRLGLATSVASAAALYFFHTNPIGLHVKNADDIVAIGTLLVTAGVASLIADSARLRAEDAEERLRLEEALRRREAERIRLEEVRASRARVMEAADKERRRVVRDLHDGAQQRLVHTVVTLKLARGALEQTDSGAPTLVQEALEQAEQATAELRELAHGILPSALTRGGLRAGIEALTSRMHLPVGTALSVGRLPPAVESTAYFVVAEALTNIAKHSRATRAEISAFVEDGILQVQVRDDGVGGARRNGDGLVGLEDRVAVLNGTLDVESPRRAGTVITASIPVPGSPNPAGRTVIDPVDAQE